MGQAREVLELQALSRTRGGTLGHAAGPEHYECPALPLSYAGFFVILSDLDRILIGAATTPA